MLLEIDLFVENILQISPWHQLHYEYVATLLAEGKGSFDQVVSCYFLENLVLCFDVLYFLLCHIFWYRNDLQGINVFCLFSPDKVDLSKGPFAQHFENLKAFIGKKLLSIEISLLSFSRLIYWRETECKHSKSA